MRQALQAFYLPTNRFEAVSRPCGSIGFLLQPEGMLLAVDGLGLQVLPAVATGFAGGGQVCGSASSKSLCEKGVALETIRPEITTHSADKL